jgi:hypothetical protein
MRVPQPWFLTRQNSDFFFVKKDELFAPCLISAKVVNYYTFSFQKIDISVLELNVGEGSEVPDLRHDVALAAQVLIAQAQEVVDHKSLQGKAASQTIKYSYFGKSANQIMKLFKAVLRSRMRAPDPYYFISQRIL